MVQDADLSAVLSEFARTLITDFPIQGILDHLVQRIVDVLPVSAAGVALIDNRMSPRFLAASNESALMFERLQTDVGEGPCLVVYESGEALAIPDLAQDNRFPAFTPAALDAGLAAVFTFPLRHGSGRLGALDLYRDTTGPLTPRNVVAAQTLADVTAAYLINAEAREEARKASDRFQHSALHDSLTGLPNRVMLEQRLSHAAQRVRRSHNSAAVLFADLDDFKQVNDTHGHYVGDELLLAVAQRLSGLIRPGDTLARFSGDEFVILCEDLHRADDAAALADRVVASFARPFALVQGADITISASVGVAFAGFGETFSNELVAKADLAMYEAKRNGGANCRMATFDLRGVIQTNDRGGLEMDLRAATVHDQLELAYQPIVRSSDGSVTGVEALLRWTHPERGVVSPLVMIGVAEQSSLIDDIGAWVLERSCRDRAAWVARYPSADIDIAVNVSPRQLMHPKFCAIVKRVLALTAMDPARLILEITESTFIGDGERAIAALSDLRGLGIRLALDDFGTGYSSLSYLKRLPIDILKIDRSFIADIGHATSGDAIVAAVTNLAHVFGLMVTAEGVETREQAEQVQAMGCEHSQGFYYARPMTAADVDDVLGLDAARTPPASTSRTEVSA